MDGDRQPPPAASVAAVLGDDDLLREILIRLGFPNYLVRAALVSKRWLLHASDPTFLRRFRDRHPPRLLGFCVGYPDMYQFVPLPQPPELAAISRRVASSCNVAFAGRRGQCVKHCRNGRLVITSFHPDRFEHSLLSPLLAGEPETVLLQTSLSGHDWEEGTQEGFTDIFLTEDGERDGITLVRLGRVGAKVSAEVYVLDSGGWGVPATAATELEFPYPIMFLQEMLPPVHGKVFLVTTFGYILGLDLAAASFFTLELPDGVGSKYMLSCAEDSGLYLVNALGFELRVWLHRMTVDDGGAGGWLLVDTFCVRGACARVAGDTWVPLPQNGDYVDVVAVGDNVDFLFLNYAASGVLLYVHLRSRLVEKVYQWGRDEAGLSYSVFGHIRCSPFMMSWPPIFPALNREHDHQG